ncbi:MAG: cyclopropane fatty acyl phospholipid synthase [Steroidobacteraceae bacterium]|nr:cyclopropane fatty acyl phospholipid synthase [Steroidobacteraceae bacterium]MDW8260553.1 cyclopropane fatty acyl phospholipid synthase [Gammaproteobacteria bacterium]
MPDTATSTPDTATARTAVSLSHSTRSRNRAWRALQQLLDRADVRLDGTRPWDIQVHDARVPERVLAEGSLGAGESYMDGWWDCAALDELFARVLAADLDAALGNWRTMLAVLGARLRNAQSRRRAFIVGERHYDIGDDLYERMLDRRMIYSCAYWRRAATLDEAQEHKLDLVCRKLGLQPGMRVLDIGCGWGGAAQFAAERYGVEVTGITISKRQAEAARERCRGLPVTILLEDYRATTGRFDRIFSIGMFEHVGARNYRTYFRQVRRLLAPDGLFLLHTIGNNRSVLTTDPWIDQYIFPNSMIPSVAQIGAASEGLWVIEDWHGFGPDYDRTLLQWRANIETRWQEIAARYNERFRRMWRYYLGSCAGAFRARRLQLWQILLSPRGVPGGLPSVR